MAVKALLILNDNLLTLTGLQDATDDSYVNDATVAVTLKDSAGVNVVGETWPLSMPYVTASNGNYQATLEDGLTLTDGALYVAEISVTASSDRIGFFKQRLRAAERWV